MPGNYLREQYAAEPETRIYPSATGGRTINKILMGTWAGVVQDDGGDRVRVVTAGRNGWIDRNQLRDSCGFKLFFIDVGQGDGMLVEVPGRRLLVDGGPNSNMYRYLRGYQYRYLLGDNDPVHIDTVLISHFDADHYAGITSVLRDENFTFGNIFHNGIARFHNREANRPAGHNTDLGRMSDGVLRTTFNDMDDARDLLNTGGLQTTFRRFLEAAIDAHDNNRLGAMRRLTVRNDFVPGYNTNSDLTIEVLGPVPRRESGAIDWPWFSNSSHTRNGHSLVLRFSYSEDGSWGKSFMLGGDLNTEAEHYLMAHYGQANPFEVDVAKSCHHGSADFTVDFMKLLKPYATVISSGDNESHAHPRADAVGCAGKYSRGTRPKVYSTELARSINSSGDILYGMINCRSDGERIIMAQMKERRTGADIWDSYEL